jgi:hypothetical protein
MSLIKKAIYHNLESLTKPPTKEEALNYMAGAEGVFQ